MGQFNGKMNEKLVEKIDLQSFGALKRELK